VKTKIMEERISCNLCGDSKDSKKPFLYLDDKVDLHICSDCAGTLIELLIDDLPHLLKKFLSEDLKLNQYQQWELVRKVDGCPLQYLGD